MAAAKAISGEYFCLSLVLSAATSLCLYSILTVLCVSLDATCIEFNHSALEHGSALDAAAAAVEDRCSTVVGSLAKAKEVLRRFYKELVPKGVSLKDVDSLADAPAAYKRKQKGINTSM